MDADALFGMIFVLLIIAMSGGFILLLPLSLRLGKLLDRRLERPDNEHPQIRETDDLRAAVLSLQQQLERLSERQAFTESLLSEREPHLLLDEPDRS